jgi:hypothetical protein
MVCGQADDKADAVLLNGYEAYLFIFSLFIIS